MLNIPYTYEIIKIDEATKTMEVMYSSEGRQSVLVSARIPYIDERLEDVIRMFSPESFWREQETPIQNISNGIVGSIGSVQLDMSLQAVKERKLQEIAAARYSTETSGILVNGSTIRTDRESQYTLTGAYVSLLNRLCNYVDWKTSNGQWVQLTISELEPIARAVSTHVQLCFSQEKELTDKVISANTIEEVENIIWNM